MVQFSIEDYELFSFQKHFNKITKFFVNNYVRILSYFISIFHCNYNIKSQIIRFLSCLHNNITIDSHFRFNQYYKSQLRKPLNPKYALIGHKIVSQTHNNTTNNNNTYF